MINGLLFDIHLSLPSASGWIVSIVMSILIEVTTQRVLNWIQFPDIDKNSVSMIPFLLDSEWCFTAFRLLILGGFAFFVRSFVSHLSQKWTIQRGWPARPASPPGTRRTGMNFYICYGYAGGRVTLEIKICIARAVEIFFGQMETKSCQNLSLDIFILDAW